jgi:hypothetical protein
MLYGLCLIIWIRKETHYSVNSCSENTNFSFPYFLIYGIVSSSVALEISLEIFKYCVDMNDICPVAGE